MRLIFSVILVFIISIGLTVANNHQIRQKPSGFSSKIYDTASSSSSVLDDNDDYDGQAQTPIGYRTRLNDYSYEDQSAEEQPRAIYQNNNNNNKKSSQISSTYSRKDKTRKSSEAQLQQQQQALIEQEEEEEPDRLTVLLQKSSFKCNDRVAGYYADESVGCEVFHYCQENQRHSWICPEGFTFHQVHLICMPPSSENICEDSSKYHIVNEYLYKPINVEEHQTKPNITLRYSERYYPESFYQDERSTNYEDRVVQTHRQPVQVGFNSQQQQQQHQYQQQQQRNKPILAATTTTTPSPIPYRFATQSSPASQQTVYRSPEEINISLQQRRPHIFLATSTPRYIDEDYRYEK